MKRFLWAVCALLALSPVTAAAAELDAQYRKQCGVCHGANGDGRGRAGANLQPPPSSFLGERFRQRSREQVIAAIRDGVPGTSMAGYGRRMNQAQLEAMADYLQQRFVRSEQTPAPLSSLAGHSGRQIYEENCSACHGDNGQTAVWARNGLVPPPRNFTAPEAREELSRERMINSVTHGRPGTGMMSFAKRLSAAQIETVVDYIRSAFMGLPAEHSAAPPAVSHYVDGLQPDVQAGREFFLQNCATCHGSQGRGDGPRAHFNTPRPRNFTTDDTRRNFDRQRLFAAIKQGKRGTVMPSWGKVLTDQQIANVAEFVFTEFVRPEKKSP